MTTVSVTIPAVPVAQPRQRHAVVGGSVRSYMPTAHPVTAFKATCRMAVQHAYNGPPLSGPIVLVLLFLFPRPRSMTWKTKPMPRKYLTKKPDIDNLAKAVMDALNGLLWGDDSQVVSLTVSKSIADGSEQSQVILYAEELEEGRGTT